MHGGGVISFVDPDDFIFSDMIELMVKAYKEYNVDMVCVSFYEIQEEEVSSHIPYDDKEKIQLCVSDTEEAIQHLCYGKCGTITALWARLYRKDIVMKYPFPNFRRAEDVATVYRMVDACKKMHLLAKNVITM